jgi:signal transduction histidine kinase
MSRKAAQAVIMSLILGQVFTLLTTPPGNLIYHLVLAFSIAGALQGAIHLWRFSGFPQARRTLIGLAILLGLQLILFLASGLAWQGYIDAQTVLPPLDRAVTLVSLAWIVWLWAFPEPVRLADAGTLILNALAFITFVLTLLFWTQRSTHVNFNASIFEKLWQVFSIGVVVLGGVILVIRKPNGWANGLSILIVSLIGHLASLIWPLEGNFPGVVRLAQLATFPILLTLPQRFPVPALLTSMEELERPTQERRRYSTDPKTFHTMMSLAAEADPTKLGHEITRSIAHAMLTDLCFLITLAEDKSLIIACGYDLIREENLDGMTVDKETIPLLSSAIQRGRALRLPASSTSTDLKGLGQLLGLTNPGHLLNVPINSQERGPIGSILILSPYSNRLWSLEDQNYLANVSSMFVDILGRAQQKGQEQQELEKARQDVQSAREFAAETYSKYEEASKELQGLREQSTQAQSQAENLAALIASQEEAQKTIEKLTAENERLHKSGGTSGSGETADQLEGELRHALKEVARMQNALAQANMKILELENRPSSPITNDQVDVIASISQELRQPMSSIVGYTDLLLGESVGILGALQRKFVERIKSSTERIGGLVDDLIQITTLETGIREFNPEMIDLNMIIDNAMAYTGTQIREKNITLRLDIPETLPKIRTDRDALQQILIHLLQNASTATPTEGTITLRVQMQTEEDNHFLLFQVADTGGGIAADDIPRVFARRYRADNSLIQGLGDTGVGLSIAKTLVEAQNGRIWVETDMGTGSTFSVLLPVTFEGEEGKQEQ